MRSSGSSAKKTRRGRACGSRSSQPVADVARRRPAFRAGAADEAGKRGELDWIVMKSLEKDRARRYDTANGFAADVQRYLAGEPVLAAPTSVSYRLKKFVHRHKGQVIAVSLILVPRLVAGVRRRRPWGWCGRQEDQRRACRQEHRTCRGARQSAGSIRHGAQGDRDDPHRRQREDAAQESSKLNDLRTGAPRRAGPRRLDLYADLEKLLAGQTDEKRAAKRWRRGTSHLAELTENIGSQLDALAVHRKVAGPCVRR